MKTLIIYTNYSDEKIINKENYDIVLSNKHSINVLYEECPKTYCYYLITNQKINFEIDVIIDNLKKYKPAILIIDQKTKIYHRSVIHYSYPLLDTFKFGNCSYYIQEIIEEPLSKYTLCLNQTKYEHHNKDKLWSKTYKWFSKCIIKRFNQSEKYVVINEDIKTANFLNKFNIFHFFDVEHPYFKMKRIKFHKNNREMYGQCGMYHFLHDFHNINRNSIINHLIKKFNYKTYLEIGVYNCVHLNDVIIEEKYGVDPSPKLDDPIYKKWSNNIYLYNSIDFFKKLDPNEKFDIIFIDGCLYEHNVTSDVSNALDHLNENGTIVLHDCNPPHSFMQRDNYNMKYIGSQGENIIWNNRNYTTKNFNGKAWKVITKFRTTRDDLEVYTVDTDWGTAIIRKGHQELFKTDEDINDYQTLVKYRKYMLNLISPEEFLEIFT